MQPSNDVSGQKDTHNLLWELAHKKHVVLGIGNYYFTKTGLHTLAMIPITKDGITIDGVDWNHTVLHMVGTETNPGADWYLFYLNGRKGFTLKNVTIDGSGMVTSSEQTHGLVSLYSTDMLLQNVRGRFIYGDTVKLGGFADNVRFIDTEHISNGRSGIAMRSYPDSGYTKGGVTIDGFYAWDVSDQAIDMEPGFEPGELIINNAKIYAREGITGFCLALTGDDASSPARLILTNSQIYGRVSIYNLSEVIIANCIIDSSQFNGRTLDIRKGSWDLMISNSIIKGNGAGDGVISMSVHGTGRPNHISLSNLDLIVANTADNTGCGIHVYDCQNVSLANINIQANYKLAYGIYRRDVTSNIDRGYFDISGVKIRNATEGVFIKHSAAELSMIDTLSIQGCHFRDVATAIKVNNPEPNTGVYINKWNFDGNLYGANVVNQVVMGSVFN